MAESDDDLRRLIRVKLVDGRLPAGRIARFWARPANGETCLACAGIITQAQLVMEGVPDGGPPPQFHTKCFSIWQRERDAPDR